ncbi:hypothetical protein ABFT23_16235 [Nocardioides sp. C4-1]|uniref:hypothetical protein n=1 Tax=Nocardioides sp. C4-1 TaxID=3151851 RepID=UPI003264610A
MDTTTLRAAARLTLARLTSVCLVLALAAAGAWFAWLGWDDEYYLVDGVAQGPYRPWQVVACGLTVVLAALVAQRFARGGSAVPALAVAATVGFAVPWSVDAASTDDSGLWVVGLVMLLVGSSVGLTVVLAVGEAVGSRRKAS